MIHQYNSTDINSFNNVNATQINFKINHVLKLIYCTLQYTNSTLYVIEFCYLNNTARTKSAFVRNVPFARCHAFDVLLSGHAGRVPREPVQTHDPVDCRVVRRAIG